jgi:phosphatidylserine/phosphatidylglycerophosphate/cardiolipin synthase-like enzyme
MAKFLDGSGVQAALTDIIKKTQSRLVIVSPFLKIPVQTKHYLASIDSKNVPITIIYRTNEKILDADFSFFSEMKNLSLAHCENLHTKCYLNENEGLITSMNLYEHSMTHNWEMGIKFSRIADPEIYNEVKQELDHMVSQTKRHVLKPKVPEPKPKEHESVTKKSYQKTPYKPTEAPKKGTLEK